MSERFDLSEHPGNSQRLIFALFGIGQLVLSSAAFQRGGFVYGLVVLSCGITAFCAAAFFVHRLNRRLVWLGPQGVVVEEGLREQQKMAWEEIDAVHLSNGITAFHRASGAAVTLHGTGKEWPDLAPFLAQLRTHTTAHQIPVEGAL